MSSQTKRRRVAGRGNVSLTMVSGVASRTHHAKSCGAAPRLGTRGAKEIQTSFLIWLALLGDTPCIASAHTWAVDIADRDSKPEVGA
jgi:hypothetical protein